MLTESLDRIDLRILSLLQDDARITNAALAEKVGLSASPCLRRVRRLEQAGLITAYRAILDRLSAGFGLTVFVEIKVGRQGREAMAILETTLSEIPEVTACHMVSGHADFLLEIVVENLAAYERLLTERLLSQTAIQDVRSNFAIRTSKANGPLPLTNLLK
ncbi:Lrp/AsnC family transcriptional regulator [Amorphus sp. 3PC139-8]|uniref:Lrp/AsnC family transcriptional regulator n=1 Tax=Amorphus sp. 3PC139-8 TaxID=2735676 RepID=UPI00345CE458